MKAKNLKLKPERYRPIELPMTFTEFWEQTRICDRFQDLKNKGWTAQQLWRAADKDERNYILSTLDHDQQFEIFLRMIYAIENKKGETIYNLTSSTYTLERHLRQLYLDVQESDLVGYSGSLRYLLSSLDHLNLPVQFAHVMVLDVYFAEDENGDDIPGKYEVHIHWDSIQMDFPQWLKALPFPVIFKEESASGASTGSAS